MATPICQLGPHLHKPFLLLTRLIRLIWPAIAGVSSLSVGAGAHFGMRLAMQACWSPQYDSLPAPQPMAESLLVHPTQGPLENACAYSKTG